MPAKPKPAANAPTLPLAIEWWPISKPKPYPKNPRQPSERAVSKVAASLKEFGWRQPIVVDAKGVIVAGHKRLEAAKKNSLKQVPVHVAKDLTAAQAKAYRLMDNRSSDDSEWDLELLAEEMGDLQALAADMDLQLTGFEQQEIDEFLISAGRAPGLTPEDAAPEPPVNPVSVLGDLWLLGAHRVLCGDSTKAEDVERLMGGEKAGLMNTDPPYGVGYANDDRPNPGVAKPRVAKPRVANDEFKDEELQKFLESCFGIALSALKPDAAWYLWHAHLTQGFFAAAAAAAAAHVILHRQIIWVKPVLLLGRGYYHWKHEPCFMGWVQGNQPPDYGRGDGERDQTTVWEIGCVTQAERLEFNHSTPKPVALFDIPIVKHLKPGEICYEPFAGSGPQIIAAQKLGVRCFALELAPQYTDVIVCRWQAFTGKSAKLDGDGRTFEEIAAARRAGTAAPTQAAPAVTTA